MYINIKKENNADLIEDRIPLYLTIVISLGLILRLYNLGKFGFWFDEAALAYTVKYSKFSPAALFELSLLDSARGLFGFLLKGWMSIFYNDYFLRLFSVIWGVLSVAMIYRLGKFIFSKEVGILSALLLSISPFHIYYSQELTNYSLSVFLALTSSYYFLKFLKNPTRLSSSLYALSTFGFIYTHYINLIFLLTQNLFFWSFYYKDRDLRKKWLYLQLIIFLLFSPWLVDIILRFFKYSQVNFYGWIPRPDLKMLLQTFMALSSGYHASWETQSITLIICLYFSLRAVYYWHKKNNLSYLIFWLMIPIGLIWLISQFSPFYLHRIFLFTLPAFCLLTAAGMAGSRELGLAILYIFVIIYSLNSYYQNKLPHDYYKRYTAVFPKKDYRKAASYVTENFREGDAIFHISRASFMSFLYYHQADFPEYGIKLNNICQDDWITGWEKIFNQYPPKLPYVVKKEKVFNPRPLLNIEKRGDLSQYKRIWLIHTSWWFQGKHLQYYDDEITKNIIIWFHKNFLRKEIRMFEAINVYLFDKLNR